MTGRLRAIACLASASCFGQFSAPKLPPHVRLGPELKAAPLVESRGAAEKPPSRCAHIIVYVPSKDVDSRMALPWDRNQSDRMSVAPPMPVCPEDVRRLGAKPATAPRP